MKKISVPIILSSFMLLGLLLSTNHREDFDMVKAEPETPTVSFVNFAGGWNPQTYGGSIARYVLNFSDNLGEKNATNYLNDIGDHFQINGVSLKTLSASDPQVFIGNNNQGTEKSLFIRFDTSNVVTSEEYPTPIFHIDGGTAYQTCVLPELTFFINTTTYAMEQPTSLTFSSFNNNVDYTTPHPSGDEGGYGAAPTIGAMMRIVFNENLLGNDKTANYEDYTDSWGNNVSMNGVRLSTIDGALVGASFGRLYIFVPSSAIELKNHDYYLVPTLHVRKEYFGLCEVPEMIFRFTGTIGIKDAWTKYEPAETDIIPGDQYLTTNNYLSLFTDGEVGKEKNKLTGQVPEYVNETNFAFEFKNDSKEGSLAIYTFSNDDYSGIRLTIDLKDNTLSLLDNSQGSVLDVFNHPFRSNEWYRIYFGIKLNDDTSIDYSLAIDDVIYLSGDDIAIASLDSYGRKIAIYSGIGVTTFNNPRPGSDIKKPVVTYTGDELYHFDVGAAKPDLKALCTAFDDAEGDVSGLIEVIWPDESLTGDVLNKGTWDVLIKSSDSSGNFDVINIKIIVSNPDEVLVTFDGENPTYYTIGDLIVKPDDPVKGDDKYSTYTFIGWFNGNVQWDFDNDHVTGDLNLVARFQKNERKYTITMVVDNNTTSLQLSYGERIDLTSYQRDGYTMTVNCDGIEYVQDVYEVRADATISITYQKNEEPVNPNNPTKNSDKNMTGLFIGLACGGAALIIGAEVLVLVLKKKGNKKKA